MLQQSGSGSIDWMNLAAKMFLSKMNEKSGPPKHRPGKLMSPPPSPLRARSPPFRPRTTVAPTTLPSHLPPDCVATIKQFEALRVQLLRQLVLYQTQLLAMKMPPLPSRNTEPVQKLIPPNKKVAQSGSRKVKKQTSSKKGISEQHNEAKKWEKIQFPAHTMKNPNKRRSQVFQKPKKGSKKASKRKLENVQTAVSTNYFENAKNETKRLCQPYKSYMRNSSSSTSSVYSTRHMMCNKDFGLESFTGKDIALQNNSYMNAASINEGKNNILTSRMSKSRTSKMNRKMSSAFAFDTATDA